MGRAEIFRADPDIARVFLPLLQPARYKAAHGGRGSAKSHTFAGLAVDAMFTGKSVLCLREFQRSLVMSAKRLIEAKIRERGMGKFFTVQQAVIKSATGGLAVFEGMQAHNSDSIKSFEDFDIAWFTEARRASERSLEILRPTLRKPGSELWFDWNPEEAKDPIEFLRTDPPPGAIVVEANFRDNPWFPAELEAERLYDLRRDPDKYAHIWEGKYRRSSEARVFRNWTVEEFDAAELPDLAGPYGGADWGFAQDPSVLIRCFVDQPNRRIYVDYEAWAIGCKIADTPDLFDKVPGARKLKIIADSARPETIDYMRDEKFDIHPAHKGPGSVEDGIEFLKAYDIIVHPRCRHVIDELTHYSWKVDRLTGEPTNELADKDNHTIDAVRYGLENVRRAIHAFW